MKLIFLILGLAYAVNFEVKQSYSAFLPEYDLTISKRHYKLSQHFKIVRPAFEYLTYRFLDSFDLIEIAYYYKDSSLKEFGYYKSTSDTLVKSARAEQAGTDSSEIVQRTLIRYERIGTWLFFDRTRKLTKTIFY